MEMKHMIYIAQVKPKCITSEDLDLILSSIKHEVNFTIHNPEMFGGRIVCCFNSLGEIELSVYTDVFMASDIIKPEDIFYSEEYKELKIKGMQISVIKKEVKE